MRPSLFFFLFLIPFASAYYGGESFVLSIPDVCSNLSIQITNTSPISVNEVMFNNSCNSSDLVSYSCDICSSLNVSLNVASINNYTFNLSYLVGVEEQSPGHGGGGGGHRRTQIQEEDVICGKWGSCVNTLKRRVCTKGNESYEESVSCSSSSILSSFGGGVDVGGKNKTIVDTPVVEVDEPEGNSTQTEDKGENKGFSWYWWLLPVVILLVILGIIGFFRGSNDSFDGW